MLVVVSIFIIVTGVVLANLPKFRDKSSLDLIAQEVALVIRQAQVYGAGTSGFQDAFPSHGVRFATGNPKQIVLFADLPAGSGLLGNGKYEPNPPCGQGGSECREMFLLRGSAVVHSLSCTDLSGGCGSGPLDIVFHRPALDAHYSFNGEVKTPGSAIIKLRDTRHADLERCVHVWKTGHIFVDDCKPHTS